MKKLFLFLVLLIFSIGTFAQTYTQTVRIEPNVYGPKLILNDPNTANKVPLEFRANDVIKWELGQRPVGSNHDLALYRYNGSYSRVMTWNQQNGNVGIGVDVPADKLEVAGTVRSSNNYLIAPGPVTTVYATNNQSGYRINMINQNGDLFRLQKDGATQLILKNSGNVGIGTTQPSTLLELSSSQPILKVRHSSEQSSWGVTLQQGSDLNAYLTASGRDLVLSSGWSNKVVLGNSNYDQYGGKVIMPWGKVGIGTDTPGAKLEVFGDGGLRVRESTHPDTYMDLNGSVSVSTLNPGITTGASRIVGRNAGHMVIDVLANDNDDSFAVRTDMDLDGVVDNIAMVIKADGNFGIGTISPSEKLSVNGNILAKKVRVSVNSADWPDYVFKSDYKLRSLDELEAYVKTNQHLPEVPNAEEVESNGLDLGEMDATLLKKVEEMTLYMIELNKALKKQGDRIKVLEKENKSLKSKGK